MGDFYYRPLIEDMTWSYSRIRAFDDCPYRFFLRYLQDEEEEDEFYASFGSFMHSILDRFYKGEIKQEEMQSVFLTGFSDSVKGDRPSADIVSNYISDALNYFKNFQKLPYSMIGTEVSTRFDFDGIPMVGIIDYIGRDTDGSLVIVDNKSRKLKPRSKRKRPTENDKTLDEMLMQLYIYSEAVFQKYGEYPKHLCFNCFLNNSYIKEPFCEEKLEETKRWVHTKVSEILNAEEFPPSLSFFPCKYLCGVSNQCCYKDMFFSK